MSDPTDAGPPAAVRRNRTAWRIGRLFGIDILVHWSFLLLLALVVAADATHGPGAVGRGLAWVVAIFGCVLVHELAHCVVAVRDGVVVDDILLLPIGGVSQMRTMPTAPSEELAIAIVGPLTSLALAGGFALAAIATGSDLWPPTLLVGPWLVRLAWLNLVLGVFNLIPALPMHEDRARATATAAKVARFIAVLMIAAGLAVDVWLVLIGIFVLLAAGAEESAAIEEADDRD